MRRSQQKKYRVRPGRHGQSTGTGDRNIGHLGGTNPQDIKVFSGLRFIVSGLYKWYVAIKYQLNQMLVIWFGKNTVAWLKVGVAAAAVILVLRNDIHFTINMGGQAPRNTSTVTSEEAGDLGVAQPMSIFSRPASRKREETTVAPAAVTAATTENYIQQFSAVAREEMQRFGIPASIKMALAIIASNSGTSEQAASYNNHFGDPLQGLKYDNGWSNWRAHSLYLMENYPSLFEVQGDYREWLTQLRKADYPGGRALEKELKQLITMYQLELLDI